MKTTHAKITTDYSRELTVKNSEYDVNLHVKDTDGYYGGKSEVYTALTHGEAAQLAAALVGENATVITDLPEVTVDADLWATASGYSRSVNQNGEDLLENAKALLAIHAFIVKRNAEKEEAKKAEAEAAKAKAKEAARDKRRDEVTQELTGDPYARYSDRFIIVKKSIDRIIELEEAAKVS